MKSLNAKRIAAIAASLAIGVAVAAQGVTFGSVPIINNQGQPVVQIVVGSGAKPSDGVVAANIAAAIGSLAHTTQNITATVSGRSQVNCVVTTPTCTLSNQQVWLGEKGLTVGAGSYSISALIGSVLNGGSLNSGNLQYTKSLLGGPNTKAYTYPDGSSAPFTISTSPNYPSVYEGVGPISVQSSVIAGTNGGGMQFTRMTNNSQDNIVRLSQSQVPGLLSNSGTYQESEFIWLGGFPVYDQASNVSNFGLLDTQAAYQVSFGKPIQVKTNGAATNAQFTLLGQNWTVYGMTPPTGIAVPSNSFVVGGNATFAQASTPQTTVYVGHNITSGPFTVVLNDLSYPNSNGLSNAALSIYKNGVLTNVTSVGPAGNTQVTINASGSKLFISVPQTFPGLYAYQKWAKIQLFSNTFNVTSGKDFNEGTNGHKWVALLRWTSNQTLASNGNSANAALQSIILYTNQSESTMLNPGQSLNIIGNPAVWKLSFVGDSLGTPGSGNSNYDPLTLSTSTGYNVAYQNAGGQNSDAVGKYTFSTSGTPAATGSSANNYYNVNDSMIKEAANYFTVSSSLPNAFIVSPESGATAPTSNLQNLQYNLDTYQFVPANAVDAAGTANLIAGGAPVDAGLVAVLQNNGVAGNYVTTSNPLTVQVTGYSKDGQSTTTSPSFTFNGFNTQVLQGTTLANLTDISLSYALPKPGVNVLVFETSNVMQNATILSGAGAANSVLLGALYYNGPAVTYSVPSLSYMQLGNSGSVTYTGENNNVNFQLAATSNPSNSVARQNYFTYTIPEITTSTSSTPNANIMVDLTNSSTILSSPFYWMNSSTEGNNAVVYQSSQNNYVKAQQGFRTERGSEVSSIGTTSVTLDMARSLDSLQFVVGPATGSNTTSTSKMYGPYGVGQATNLQNVTIGKVNATCTFTTSSCNVTGLNSLTATPSVSTAVVGNPLNTAQNPIAVLDSQANNSSAMIVVGSKYVNSVAAQIFAQQPSLASFGPSTDSVIVQAFGNKILVAGYTANQTVQAGNQFIQDLLQNASS